MSEAPRALRDFDSGERLLAAKAFLYPTAGGLVFGVLASFYLMETRHLGLGGAVLVVALGGLVGVGLGGLVWFLTGRVSRGFVGLLTAAGNIRPSPSFSLQESLIVRGRYAEAARGFEAHLATAPRDDEARLALAGLLAAHLDDSTGAERLLREVVEQPSSARAEWTAANALIDLRRAAGLRGPLMAELARFADRYRGTAAAAAAKRELLALTGETTAT